MKILIITILLLSAPAIAQDQDMAVPIAGIAIGDVREAPADELVCIADAIVPGMACRVCNIRGPGKTLVKQTMHPRALGKDILHVVYKYAGVWSIPPKDKKWCPDGAGLLIPPEQFLSWNIVK